VRGEAMKFSEANERFAAGLLKAEVCTISMADIGGLVPGRRMMGCIGLQ